MQLHTSLLHMASVMYCPWLKSLLFPENLELLWLLLLLMMIEGACTYFVLNLFLLIICSLFYGIISLTLVLGTCSIYPTYFSRDHSNDKLSKFLT